MKRIIIAFLALLFSGADVYSQHENLIINIRDRNVSSLNGKWRYLTDVNRESRGYERNMVPIEKWDIHEYNFPTSDWLYVPGDWNTQRENLFYYEGHIWYQKDFQYKKASKENRLFLYFGAVNYKAEVYLNGILLGKHTGGFTPFNVEVHDSILHEENSLVVLVDNVRDTAGVPSFSTGWWNYGGITRDVFIVELSNTFIRDYFVQLDNNDPTSIKGYVQLDGDNLQQEVEISIPGLEKLYTGITNAKGRIDFRLKSSDIELWDINNPKLYDVYISSRKDTVHEKIGFRTITTRGSEILLNGKSVFLRGISIHEESPMREGRAWSEEDAEILLKWAKELNCNFVRLAHYPHNEHILRHADKTGMLVWEELPLFWAIEWDNESTYKLAEEMATELVTRDKNRASTIIWSVANETGNEEARNIFLTNLIKLTREMDDTRLVSAALMTNHKKSDKKSKVVDDLLGQQIDIISVNEYFGWYQGLPQDKDNITWKIEFDKPFMFSETGAGALQGFHGDSLTRWSEEYMAYYYRKTIEMFDRIPQLRGVSPWILVDFYSPQRVYPYIQDNYLRKGLISDRGEKKSAFFLLQEFYLRKKQEAE